ncbi:MAG: hypothetical protein IKN98_05020 [Bacteroidales bacterium]|nr:hypothetical protein [Bacteroidales bacterium]
MKKLVTFLVILVMSLTAAMAQSAAKLNYQAVVRSSDNHLASNETVNVTIDIKVSGTSVFSETHNAVNTNINGLLNLIIGEGTAQTGDLATIDWAHATIEATITWGENTVTTSNPVYAVPLALSANVDCSTVVGCVDDAIENSSSTTNNAIDTVIVNHLTPYEIKNCDDVVACPIIQNMRDSIQSNYEEIQHLTTDLNTLETRVETFNTHVCDSVKDCVAAQIHDSLVAHPVYNSTITFQQEGETDQFITLNQSTNQTITIVTYSQKSKKFSATAAQNEFELGETPDTDNHLVQMYINGVYVGDTEDSVVKISGTKAQYQKVNNNNYDLVAGDRVQFVYWVK